MKLHGNSCSMGALTESGVSGIWRLAAYLVDLLLWDSSPTERDTPPWKRLTLLILRVETGSRTRWRTYWEREPSNWSQQQLKLSLRVICFSLPARALRPVMQLLLSLKQISDPTKLRRNRYAAFGLKKKKIRKNNTNSHQLLSSNMSNYFLT